ncbi:hypothetical protein F5X96DRAFT_644688 [Biscogniauxia mediterranea]|nr:hypothetical protein F5X96DRAFT_644688 [Biscogniauxia mediterranea]
MSDTTPLLPRLVNSNPSQGDSHPITLRACHSPWRGIGQTILFLIRLVVAGYLSAVSGVSLKYKLENQDDHTRWRIPFQFSTVSFCLLWAYHLLVTVWTGMHLFVPQTMEEEDSEDSDGHRLRTRIVRLLSPPRQADRHGQLFAFSMFYTIAHVFAFMNTIIYWGLLVPSGHGGFKPPNLPDHSQHRGNQTASIMYDPDKGLFEEDPIKSFSILNLSTITSLIGGIEIFFLNSIRRQTPVAAHTAGVMCLSGAYLAWAGIGKLLTGHAGLFFLDPKLMGDIPEATIAACIAFIALSPGFFSYMYGLIAMRETMTAAHRDSSQ